MLIEASRLVPDAITMGSDIARNALQAAAGNGRQASRRWVLADVGQLPFADGCADCVVANLPWGRQVQAPGTIQQNISQAVDEIMRVLAPGGNAVLLSSLQQSIVSDRWRPLWTIPIRIAGHWAKIQILSAERDCGKSPECLLRRDGPSLQRMWTKYGEPAV